MGRRRKKQPFDKLRADGLGVDFGSKHLAMILALLWPLAAHAGEARWTGPIPETASSHIFSPVVLPGTAEARALQAAGYVQEEYFLSGTANIWRESGDGTLSVKQAGMAYTTRLVLVRPRDPRRFNGVVHLGFTHPQLASAQWGRIDAHVLRTGAAYALLTVGGDQGTRQRSTVQWPVSTPLLFAWYDPARYAAFAWPEDDGIRWDVIGQAASRLRDPGSQGPLAGLRVRRLLVSGWSFLGSLQRSYINFGFHERYRRKDGSPVVDGYLIGISAGAVPSGRVPLNSADPAMDRTRDPLRMIDSPVIELTSEMEAITNIHPLRAESDAAQGGYRIYELGGTSHSDSGVAGQVRAAAVQLAARRHPALEPSAACTVEDTDVPMRDVAMAALANLERWTETGKAPPRAPRLVVAPGGKDYMRDRFGLPLGGIRAAQLDLPLVRYGAPPPEQCGGKPAGRSLKQVPLGPELLAEAYQGSASDYLARFRRRLDALAREGWLLRVDAAAQYRAAARKAARLLVPAGAAMQAEGTLPGGAKWIAERPARWNGTLLLWSRGYSPRLGDPELAQNGWRETLVAAGYALAASDYGSAGWALAEAVPAQEATLAAVTARLGKPRRVIGWGNSMGGLVSAALAEKPRPRIDGAIAMCPSIGGATGMMNLGLDGAFAFRTLIAPDAGLELVNVRDDVANSRAAGAALAAAMKSPEGRARVALAGVLGGVPGWTRRDRPRPADSDYAAQVEEIAASFVMGVFLPRGDQERRAGGAFSWNTGIDYARQLDRSGRRAMVEALYHAAGLDLAGDLARLAAAPRIAAEAGAADYMLRHYTPSARPSVPLVSAQAIGDGMTVPALQQAYADMAPPARFSAVWLDAAGHCGFGIDQAMNLLRHLEARLDTGEWPNEPAGAIRHTAAPMLRPCFRGGKCE